MASKFFATGDTSSESDSEDSTSSVEDEVRASGGAGALGVPGRTSRFNMSDSDSDEVARVVRSAKDRRFDALVETAQKMKNHININDWISIQADFDLLNKQLEKTCVKDLVTGLLPPIPAIYFAAQITLETACANKPDKLSKTNAKAYNAMKQKIRKNARLIELPLEKYRQSGGEGDIEAIARAIMQANKIDSDSDSDSDSTTDSSDSDDTASDSDSGASAAPPTRQQGDGGNLSPGWSDSDGDSDDSYQDGPRTTQVSRISNWIRAEKSAGDQPATAARRVRGERRVTQIQSDEEFEEEPTMNREEMRKQELELLGQKAKEMPLQEVDERMQELLASRGKKGTSRKGQIEKIEFLALAAKSNRQQCEILLHLIAAIFDFVPSQLVCISADRWKSALDTVARVLSIVQENHPRLQFSDDSEVTVAVSAERTIGPLLGPGDIPLTESAAAGAAALAEAEAAKKNGEKRTIQEIAAEGAKENETVSFIRGDMVVLMERLDDELYKAWQNMDAYSAAYVARLRDENPLMLLLNCALKYYEAVVKDLPRAARIASRLILHLYYKSSEINDKLRGLYSKDPDSPNRSLLSTKSLQELSVLVYRYGDERSKSQTMLCHIYNLALSDRFFEARDMLLMSHMQESVMGMDIPMQVLFNRTMAQVGLCAFRAGKIYEAHACLQELYPATFTGGMRTKELLAQGYAQHRGFEKTAEQEKAERRRQVPYHMHLNLDLCETAHLVSAMLLEVPNLALNQLSGQKRRVISKTFQYYLRSSLKQAFPGPPENTRDHVMAASRALMKGDWAECYKVVTHMRVWKSMPSESANKTLACLKDLIKVESLRTYVVTYSSFYDAMGMAELSERFALSSAKVHSVISKMVVNDELRASWDQPTRTVAVQRSEPSRLQALGLEMAQKCTFLVEQNEKLMDAKVGGLGGRDGDRDDWSGRGGRGRGRGRGGGGSYGSRGGSYSSRGGSSYR